MTGAVVGVAKQNPAVRRLVDQLQAYALAKSTDLAGLAARRVGSIYGQIERDDSNDTDADPLAKAVRAGYAAMAQGEPKVHAALHGALTGVQAQVRAMFGPDTTGRRKAISVRKLALAALIAILAVLLGAAVLAALIAMAAQWA